MSIPFLILHPQDQKLLAELRQSFEEVVNAGQFILGENVTRFEAEFVAFSGARFGIGVASGTDALELSLRALGIKSREEEVLLPALTSPFTALAVWAAGAKPQFADVDVNSLLLDPADVEQRITSYTRALIPVHLYGQVCQLNSLNRIAQRHDLEVIQDACQAHGACYRQMPLTKWSATVAFSFYPTKNLGACGDGGMVLTDREEVAHSVRLLRHGGMKGDRLSHTAGKSSRLDELQAALLRCKLHYLADWNAQRKRLAQHYRQRLTDVGLGHLLLESQSDISADVHHLFVIRSSQRDSLREFLAQNGIETLIHYPQPLHLQPAFASLGYRRNDFPEAGRACREILSLPLYPELSVSAVDHICEVICAFYGIK